MKTFVGEIKNISPSEKSLVHDFIVVSFTLPLDFAHNEKIVHYLDGFFKFPNLGLNTRDARSEVTKSRPKETESDDAPFREILEYSVFFL